MALRVFSAEGGAPAALLIATTLLLAAHLGTAFKGREAIAETHTSAVAVECGSGRGAGAEASDGLEERARLERRWEDCEEEAASADSWADLRRCRSFLVRRAITDLIWEQQVDRLTFTFAGKHLAVTNLESRYTQAFRESTGLAPEVFVRASDFDLDYSVSTAGGKSGSGFASLGQYVVKYGLRDGDGIIKYMNEPQVFRDLAPRLATEWDTLPGAARSPKATSLLNKIYLMLKLEFGDKIEYVAVVEEAFYGVDKLAQHWSLEDAGVRWRVFDLKGKSRENGNAGFPEYFPRKFGVNDAWGGQLPLSRRQCDAVSRSFLFDVANVFLQAPKEIIDYSLLVGVVDLTSLAGRGKAPTDYMIVQPLVDMCRSVAQPLCFVTDNYVITLSIIDYLNELNGSKDLENLWSVIKKALKFQDLTAKFEAYHAEMLRFIGFICPPSANYPEEAQAIADKLGRASRNTAKDTSQSYTDFDALENISMQHVRRMMHFGGVLAGI